MISIIKRVGSSKSSYVKYFSKLNDITKSPVIKVTQGLLRGAVKQLYDGFKYYSFKGIPYADPPVGELRFKAPVPRRHWHGIYEALNHGPVCPQVDLNTMRMIKGDEDCLYLNVYTKSLDPGSKLPVIVLIPGGAFMSGSGNSDIYGPDFLLQHDVVLVTINFRLEVLGFLCLETPEVPGNAGMKDQVAALRWIQDNIAQFGGNPNNVTLCGESSAAACVTYHMLSSMSDGLFHKAIAQSGVCIGDWALAKGAKERAFRAGKVLGKETNSTKDLVNFLRNVPATDLGKLTFRTLTYDEKHRGMQMHFVPVIEKVFNGVEAFLTKSPIDLILSNKIKRVPFVIGYNSCEGIFYATRQLKILDFMNRNLEFSVPREIAERVSLDKSKEIGEKIRKYYVGDREYSRDDVVQLCEKENGFHLLYNTHRFTHLYSKLWDQIYMYKFFFDTDLNLMKKTLGWSHLKGACHTDELYYLFSNDLTKDIYERQHQLREIVYGVTKLWTDFAKTSNPTPDDLKWSPYTTANKECFFIKKVCYVENFADRENVEFWNQLYRDTGLPCIT